MIRRLLLWILAVTAAGILVGVADALVVVLGAKEMFFTPQEMWRCAFYGAGLCAMCGAILSIPLGLLLGLYRESRRKGGVLESRRRFLLATALPLSALTFVLLWLLTGGPQASSIPLRPIMVGLAALVTGAVAAWIIFKLAPIHSKGRGPRLMVAFAFLLGALLAYYTDLTVLLRLYPAFHIALSLLSFVFLACALAFLLPTSASRLLAALSLILFLGSLGLGVYSAKKLSLSQNMRYVLTEKTSTAGELVSFLNRLFPPATETLFLEPEEDLPPEEISGLHLSGSPVVMISVDAMRYDRVSTPGAKRSPATNFDRLAKKSIVFERAYTAIPHTSYAVTSLLTGKYVAPLSKIPGTPEVHETWPEILKRFRYKTAGFFTKAVFFIDRAKFEPYLRSRYGFDEAYIEYDVKAQELADRTIDWMKKEGQNTGRLFSWTHFFEPHEPYEKTCTTFGDSDEARYDCEIATADEAAGRIIDHVEKNLPGAIIIITADHGEEFGDHGGRYHGTTLYDEQVRVPLIIRVPGVEHKRVKEPVSLVDLLGTILSALEIPTPARVRSNDLTPLIKGNGAPRTAIAQAHHEVMAVGNGKKLIWNREEGLTRLYDLVKDPRETRSIADSEPEAVMSLKQDILRWERDHTRVELRPIVDAEDTKGWPLAIRQVLSGERDAVINLPGVLESSNIREVRRKAASLIADEWEGGDEELKNFLEDGDPVVRAWIGTRCAKSSPDCAKSLVQTVEKLEEMTPVWRRSVLTSSRVTAPMEDRLITILASKESPVPDRLEAVEIISEHPFPSARKPLEENINVYQLALPIVSGLVSIGDKRSIPILLKRLKRERFPERRATILEAMTRLKKGRWVQAAFGELARKEPPTNCLGILVRGELVPERSASFNPPDEDGRIHVFKNPEGTVSIPKAKSLTRAVVRVAAATDCTSLEIRCGEDLVGSTPVVSGEHEYVIDFEKKVCAAQDKHLEVHMDTSAKCGEMVIPAAAFVEGVR